MSATKRIQPSEYNQVNKLCEFIQVYPWIQPNECNKVNMKSECNTVNPTKWVQAIECDQVNKTNAILCEYCWVITPTEWISECNQVNKSKWMHNIHACNWIQICNDKNYIFWQKMTAVFVNNDIGKDKQLFTPLVGLIFFLYLADELSDPILL